MKGKDQIRRGRSEREQLRVKRKKRNGQEKECKRNKGGKVLLKYKK